MLVARIIEADFQITHGNSETNYTTALVHEIHIEGLLIVYRVGTAAMSDISKFYRNLLKI